MKKTVTALQRANAEFVRDVMWPSIPERNVNLSRFNMDYGYGQGTPATCGTIACFGGWIAQNPFFQAQGVIVDSWDGAPRIFGLRASDVAEKLFGDRYLFNSRLGYGSEYNWMSDHQAVAHRIKELIKSTKVAQ